MTWNARLDEPFRSIGLSDSARIGVLAGPGTGKTTYGLMGRVARLLETGTPGNRILLVSFTRVAAADLRDKIADLQAPGADLVRATTLHGYCFSVSQRDAVLAITRRVPRILLNHEIDLMLRDIGGDHGTLYDRQRLLEAYMAGWARTTDDHPGLAVQQAERVFETDVIRWLTEHEAMLIGEVVPLAHRYLSDNPAASELDSFDHVVVDEYQDLNALEQQLLEVIATRSESLCIAGDDDQSIYSVRYANPDGIHSFLRRSDVEAHAILVCARLPANLLSMANSLIEQTPGRQKDPMVPIDASRIGDVSIVQWDDVDSEIDGIVSAIAGDVGSRRRSPGQILVLTNWRSLGERIRQRLVDLEIPVRSFFTEEELANEVARESVALLRLVVAGHDPVALRVLLALEDDTGRTAAYQRLLTSCRGQAIGPSDLLQRLVDGSTVPGLRVPSLADRYSGAMGKVEHLREMDLDQLVNALFPSDNELLADLRAVALEAMNQIQDSDELLDHIISAITQDDVPQHPNFVRVMSLHKSKGLTSECVYVAGAVNGVLPTIRTPDPNAIASGTAEGRRLFYVAVTRASEELVISSSVTMDLAHANARGVRYERRTIRRSGDRHAVRTIASPYIAELGPDAPRAVRGRQWLEARPL